MRWIWITSSGLMVGIATALFIQAARTSTGSTGTVETSESQPASAAGGTQSQVRPLTFGTGSASFTQSTTPLPLPQIEPVELDIGITLSDDAAEIDPTTANVLQAPSLSPEMGLPPDQISPRVVHIFDFEEQKLGNFESMPIGWERVAGPGFPAIVEIGFDDQVSHSTQHSLKMSLSGGSAAIQLERGTIPAVPMADYLIMGRVQTGGLEYAKARVVASFVDQHGQVVLESVVNSTDLVSEGEWTEIQLQLFGEYPEAAWISLRLELLQPEMRGGGDSNRAGASVLEQDITGHAWFDDIVIYQQPRLELVCQSRLNIIRQPDRPILHSSVRDFTGQYLIAELIVYDESGTEVDRMEKHLGGLPPAEWSWQPNLPRLGWYWADLRVRTKVGLIGRSSMAFMWLPEQRNDKPYERDRFVILIEDIQKFEEPLLRQVLEQLGTCSGQLPVRMPSDPEVMIRESVEPDPLVRRLLVHGHVLTLGLTSIPLELAKILKIDTDRPLDMLASDPKVWGPYLETLLVRYGGHIQRWQLGPSGSMEASQHDDLAELYPQILTYFRRFLTDPKVVLPWPAYEDLGAAKDIVQALIVDLPVSVRPENIVQYKQNWPDNITDLTLILNPPPADRFGHIDRVEDLVMRMVHAWRLDIRRLAIERPWDQLTEFGDGLVPDPLLAVWANVAGHLSGRKFADELELGKGMKAIIFEGVNDPRDGVLVVWNEGAAPKDAKIDMYLGEEPVQVDSWGTKTPITMVEGKHQMSVGSVPRFIEGADISLAKFRARFKMTPKLAKASFSTHYHQLTIENPWPQTMSGTIRMVAPDSWRFQPVQFPIDIQSGQKRVIDMEIRFPIGELAGEKVVKAVAEFDTDKRYKVEVTTEMEIGVKDLVFHPSLRIEGGNGTGGDIVITHLVTNDGELSQTLVAYAWIRDHPRQERVIGRLGPGETAIKVFRFSGAAARLSGTSARVGVRQKDGPIVLNKKLEIP